MDSSLSVKDSSGRHISLLNDQPSSPMGKRRYHCTAPGCQKSFTTSGHLARHHRIHTGEKNFQCLYPGCPSRFSRQDNMMQHYRTHMSLKSRRHQQQRRAMQSASSSSQYHYHHPYYQQHHPYYYGHPAIPAPPSPVRQFMHSMNYPPPSRDSSYPRAAAMPYHLPPMVLPKPHAMVESRFRRASSISSSSSSSVSSFPSPPASTTTLLPSPHALFGNTTSTSTSTSTSNTHPLDQRKTALPHAPPSTSISDLVHFVNTFG